MYYIRVVVAAAVGFFLAQSATGGGEPAGAVSLTFSGRLLAVEKWDLDKLLNVAVSDLPKNRHALVVDLDEVAGGPEIRGPIIVVVDVTDATPHCLKVELASPYRVWVPADQTQVTKWRRRSFTLLHPSYWMAGVRVQVTGTRSGTSGRECEPPETIFTRTPGDPDEVRRFISPELEPFRGALVFCAAGPDVKILE